MTKNTFSLRRKHLSVTDPVKIEFLYSIWQQRNKMTFLGNIVYLRPRSVIYGPSVKGKGCKWHYQGANKKYCWEKLFYYHYYWSIYKAK